MKLAALRNRKNVTYKKTATVSRLFVCRYHLLKNNRCTGFLEFLLGIVGRFLANAGQDL